MKFNPLTAIISGLFILWCGWILIASDPVDRIDRSCIPVVWLGKPFVALTKIVTPNFTSATQDFFGRRFMDCRFMVYDTFYAE